MVRCAQKGRMEQTNKPSGDKTRPWAGGVEQRSTRIYVSWVTVIDAQNVGSATVVDNIMLSNCRQARTKPRFPCM